MTRLGLTLVVVALLAPVGCGGEGSGSRPAGAAAAARTTPPRAPRTPTAARSGVEAVESGLRPLELEVLLVKRAKLSETPIDLGPLFTQEVHHDTPSGGKS
jgi:hypothetical protein